MNGAFGPFLGIYLLTAAGWDQASIGLLGTIAGIAGLVAQSPMGAFIDTTRKKRGLILLGCAAVALGALAVAFHPDFAVVVSANLLMALAGTIFGPAVVALTRGICARDKLVPRLGRNAAFDHAGNVTIALVAAAIGSIFPQRAVFFLVPICASLAAAAVLSIPPHAIDHRRARGLEDGQAAPSLRPSSLRALAENRTLLLFALCTALFQFANGPMLPLVGQKLALMHHGEATALMSACIIAAQAVMLPMAMIVGAYADRIGRKPFWLAAFAILPIRACLDTLSDARGWLVGVQLLDGIGAGLFGALTPILLADITRGTGRFNMSQGAIATVQGASVAASSLVAGVVAQKFGYRPAFLALGAVALAAFVTFLVAIPETGPGATSAPAALTADPVALRAGGGEES